MYPKRSDRHAKRGVKGKAGALLISLLALLTLTVGGTVAYLVASTDNVVNTFTPSEVSCEVTENFDGTYKTNVNVINGSEEDNIAAYLRVKLVSYRVNGENQHIGGVATVPTFTPGAGWVLHEGYYYYTSPVDPGEKPAIDLISSIKLQEYPVTPEDPDGGKQVIEVMAEAIQSKPKSAVADAWGDDVAALLVTDTDTTTQP